MSIRQFFYIKQYGIWDEIKLEQFSDLKIKEISFILYELGNQYSVLNWIYNKAIHIEQNDNNFIKETIITKADFENFLNDCNKALEIIETMLKRTNGIYQLTDKEFLDLSFCFNIDEDDKIDDNFVSEINKAKEICEYALNYYNEQNNNNSKGFISDIYYESWE